jgi:hypothetical protein
VDKVFKTLAKLASIPLFFLAKTENNWPKIQKLSAIGETNLAKLASGFVILLVNPKFYSHWRVGE